MMWQRLGAGPLPVLLVALLCMPAQTAVAQPVTCIIEGACPEATYEGGAVAIHVRCSTETGIFSSLDLLSLERDGTPAVPVNTPTRTGLSGAVVPGAEELILHWETAPGDAGSWEICFEGAIDLGDADTCCYTVVVSEPDPDHVAWDARRIQFNPASGPFPWQFKLSTTHSYDSTFGIALPFLCDQVSGAAYFATSMVESDVVFPPEFDVFESQSVITWHPDAGPPDSLILGLIDFDGHTLGPGSYDIKIHRMLEAAEGIILVDSAKINGAEIGYNVDASFVIDPTYSPGCYAVTIATDCPLVLTGDVDESGTLTSADIIRMVGTVFKSDFRFTRCYAQGDVNCDGALTAADIIYTVNSVFKSGPLPCNVCPLIWNGIWTCE
jgi:hypothetical protein